mgnify:CR=1 FL=1
MPRHLFIALALCVVSISAPALADRKHHKGHHGHHDGDDAAVWLGTAKLGGAGLHHADHH